MFMIYYQMKFKSHPNESPDEAFDIDYLRDADKFWLIIHTKMNRII